MTKDRAGEYVDGSTEHVCKCAHPALLPEHSMGVFVLEHQCRLCGHRWETEGTAEWWPWT